MNSLKQRRKRKDRYERLSNESLEKRLAFNATPVLTDADLQFASFGTGDETLKVRLSGTHMRSTRP
jgi:hypothetical protein